MSVALNNLCHSLHRSCWHLRKYSSKVFDHLAQYHCSICKSKKVSIDGDDSDENGMVQKCYLRCEKCGSITEVDFEKVAAIAHRILLAGVLSNTSFQ